MKKNLTFKLGLFCAALVLVATCFVTNAWAKYTKSVTAYDEARVARFSVSTSIEGDKVQTTSQQVQIFDTAFTNIQGDNDTNTDKLIAPGSHGSFEIVLSNSSEVTVEYVLTATDTNSGQIPMVWSCGSITAGSLSDLLTQIGPKVLGSVSNPETPATETITISWSWAYSGGDDAFDTSLGEKVELDKYRVDITCVATQVQPQ